MNNEDFLAKCRSIDPSAEVDRGKNLDAIKTRLKKEEEQNIMSKNKKFRRPAVAAALLAGLLSLSIAVYAAAPAIWRYFDTRVVQGEEFVNNFFMGEIDMPDGTTSVGIGVDIDREALEAAGGGAVIVEVDGKEWVVLDELYFDNLEDGMALLQLDNALIPRYLPEGFSFSRFIFPVNPNNHQYSLGNLPAAESARVYFSNAYGDEIRLQIGNMPDDHTLGVLDGQQGLIINSMSAVLSNSALNADQLAALENITIFEGEVFDESPFSVSGTNRLGTPQLSVMHNGIAYVFFTESQNVTACDLVRMAASMK